MSERPTLFDALVDLAVYAPIGLALTAAEELPELIAKGRARIEPQLGSARLVGQLVVAEGRRRAVRYSGFGGPSAPTQPASRPANGSAAGAAPSPTRTGRASETSAAGPSKKKAPAKRPSSASGAAKRVPDVTSLAIHGYDSLSASQVVQRLAGLSPAELAAVGRYEAAMRGRRTILARVAQLQGD